MTTGKELVDCGMCGKGIDLTVEGTVTKFQDGTVIHDDCIRKYLDMDRISQLIHKRDNYPGEWLIPKDRDELHKELERFYHLTQSSDLIKAKWFYDHIMHHLDHGQEPVCKICGMSASEIYRKEGYHESE